MSASIAGLSRVHSSTIVRARKVRPVPRVSLTKSIAQRWFGLSPPARSISRSGVRYGGASCGASPSPAGDTAGKSSYGSQRTPRAAAMLSGVDSQSAAADALSCADDAKRHPRPSQEAFSASSSEPTGSTCKRGAHSFRTAQWQWRPRLVCSQALEVFS